MTGVLELWVLTLSGEGHGPGGGGSARVPDPDGCSVPGLPEQLLDPLLVLWVLEGGQGAELASAEPVGPGEGQGVIGQLEGPVRRQVDQSGSPWRVRTTEPQNHHQEQLINQ